MNRLLILYEPHDKLDKQTAGAKIFSESGKTPTRYLDDLRNKDIED